MTSYTVCYLRSTPHPPPVIAPDCIGVTTTRGTTHLFLRTSDFEHRDFSIWARAKFGRRHAKWVSDNRLALEV